MYSFSLQHRYFAYAVEEMKKKKKRVELSGLSINVKLLYISKLLNKIKTEK